MSDVIYTISYNLSKGFLKSSAVAADYTASMAVAGMNRQVLALSTNASVISTAGLSSVGFAYLQNISANTAATCTVGIDAGGSFVGFTTLKAGEPAMMRLSAGTEYSAIGSSGSRLRVDILEN